MKKSKWLRSVAIWGSACSGRCEYVPVRFELGFLRRTPAAYSHPGGGSRRARRTAQLGQSVGARHASPASGPETVQLTDEACLAPTCTRL